MECKTPDFENADAGKLALAFSKLSQNGTDGRVYGGDCNLIHVADGHRAEYGAALAHHLDGMMRDAAYRDGERTWKEAVNQPLCPGCYMVVGFDMMLTLAKENGQSIKELARTMRDAFDNLLNCEDADAQCIEHIRITIDPE